MLLFFMVVRQNFFFACDLYNENRISFSYRLFYCISLLVNPKYFLCLFLLLSPAKKRKKLESEVGTVASKIVCLLTEDEPNTEDIE